MLSRSELWRRIKDLLANQRPRHERLENYYRNPMLPRGADSGESISDRPYRQAQEWGLPARLIGDQSTVGRKEVVIENDIAWRIDTAVDYLFGQPIKIESTVKDKARAAQIEAILNAVIDLNGGVSLLQHLATLGSIHGFVDVLVKLDPNANPLKTELETTELASDAAPASSGTEAELIGDAFLPPLAEPASREESDFSEPHLDEPIEPGTRNLPSFDVPVRIAQLIRLEIVEPARALPVLADMDWRKIDAYVQVLQYRRTAATAPRAGTMLARLGNRAGNLFRDTIDTQKVTVTDICTADAWQRWEDDQLISSGVNSLGQIPLVHIQNLPVPFNYSGVSDVEALIPCQDELNTRLSDRANRITLQSFKMYLGVGIDGFTETPVGPGQMWMTDNPDAKVISFGGDAACPSEDTHIDELRESMDKISAVSPIAAGILRDKIGNLTSAVALRVTLTALLARTQRKRGIYGAAIVRICELALAWLDVAGVFKTDPSERKIQIKWADLLSEFDLGKEPN